MFYQTLTRSDRRLANARSTFVRDVRQMCEEAQSFCDEHLTLPYYLSGLNPYDIRYSRPILGYCARFFEIIRLCAFPSGLSA